MTSYINPWFKSERKTEYGPRNYTTDAKPKGYQDYLIYERIQGHVWDVVKDGTCITQMAGPNGARQAIDKMLVTRGKELN